MMKSVLEVLKATTSFLEKKGFEQPRREAEELLARALNVTRMELYLDFERPLPEEELALCRSFLQRRLAGEPFGYIAGKQQFLNCEILVNPSVLIPRNETEILTDNIVSTLKGEALENKRLLDLCCGSGCIGLALKNALPLLDVTLSDLSPQALDVAKGNAKRNGLEVTFAEGDLLKPVAGQKFDYVVCNPPYISEAAYSGLAPGVKDFEPKMALVSGPTGLEIYAKLADALPSILNGGAKVWLEIGFDQGDSVPSLFEAPCWKNKVLSRDWSGHNRFFFLEFE